ncbi:hypothetical protein PHMEG_00037589, partial [Phytophthora megakarya]
LETCGDRDLERQLTPSQLRDIHTLEDIVSDIQKVEKRVSNRSSSQSSSGRDDKRHTSSSGSYGRHENLITELQTRASSEKPDEYSNDYYNDDPIDFYEEDEADQDECDSDCGSRDEMQVTSVHKTMDNSQVDLVKVDPDLCRLCQQVHDFGKCEAFDELAKILRTNVDKKNISPELQKLVFADLVIDAECLYAFTGKCEWPGQHQQR